MNTPEKPEIFYDYINRDLFWLPKHSRVITEVAQELFQKGHHYDCAIRGIEGHNAKSCPPYLKWACLYPNPLLNHPRIKEILMPTRTVPTKDQVLAAAEQFPFSKDFLKILFPQDFEDQFDWCFFRVKPFSHLKVESNDRIVPSKELLAALRKIGKPISLGAYPSVNLRMLAALLSFLENNCPEK